MNSTNGTKFPCLQGPKEYIYYAITINPLMHKRVTLKISGQKSVCKKYMNYSHVEQRELLRQLLEPLREFLSDEVFEEKTENGNLHVHSTMRFAMRYDALSTGFDELRAVASDVNKRCADKSQTYIAFDYKLLNDDVATAKWYNYIRKTLK